MTPEQVFAIKYDRLDEYLKRRRVIDLVDISAILRHRLADESRLIDQPNRTRRLKFQFEVGSSTEEDNRDRSAGGGIPPGLEVIQGQILYGRQKRIWCGSINSSSTNDLRAWAALLRSTDHQHVCQQTGRRSSREPGE